MDKTFKYKEKEYEFIKPCYEFRIWSNYFVEKYQEFMKPIRELKTKQTDILLKMSNLNTGTIIKEAVKGEQDKIKESIIETVSDTDYKFSGEHIELMEELKDKTNIYLDKFLFGYIDSSEKKVSGQWEKLLKNCLIDFDCKVVDLDDNEIYTFVIEVLDYFFTRTGKAKYY